MCNHRTGVREGLLVRGLTVRMLWQNEPERFERMLALWRTIVESYVGKSR